jgi:kynureninase
VSTTQLLHNLSTALKFQPGDELIVSKLNHEANSAPWARIAERLGLTVKWWASSDPKNPTCDVADLKTLLSGKTRLVACPHVSNITGTISPIREIADAVHAHPRVSLSPASYDIPNHIYPKEVFALTYDISKTRHYSVLMVSLSHPIAQSTSKHSE